MEGLTRQIPDSPVPENSQMPGASSSDGYVEVSICSAQCTQGNFIVNGEEG